MSHDIEKYRSETPPDKTPVKNIFQYYRNPYIILFGGIILIGLTTLAGTGLLAKKITIVIEIIFIEIAAINQFFKYRKHFYKKWHWITVVVCIFFFAFLGLHLFFTASSGDKPNIDIAIYSFTIQKRNPPVSEIIKFENTRPSSAYHFFCVVRLCLDTVTERDSLDLLEIVNRHKEENNTLVKELITTKTPIDSLSEKEFSILSKSHPITLGAISYYDESNAYHLIYFCFEHGENNTYKNYPKYNFGD
jgi:hypothetical protein